MLHFWELWKHKKKQTKGLENLEKRLLKAQRKKLVNHIKRITELQQQLFPLGDLQERRVNFAAFILQYGDDFIPTLIKHIDPFNKDFRCLCFFEIKKAIDLKHNDDKSYF